MIPENGQGACIRKVKVATAANFIFHLQAGARQGAPQAIQTADRFHLYKNLVEAVELALARCRTEIRNGAALAFSEEERKVMGPLSLPTEFVAVENWKPAPDACTERERLTRRAERHDRYEQVTALRLQGLGNAEIARRVGLTARTRKHWQKKGSFPEAARRRKRPSRFDPYACYVLSRWEQGCQNGSQLYREIKEQGYTGQERQVHRFLLPLRKQVRIMHKAGSAHIPVQDFSAKDAVWLFVRDPTTLDEKEQATLTAICQASETARTIYQVVQEFRHMLHTRSGDKLDGWLAKVTASQIRELQSFVLGVERDKAAVVAGLTLPQNTGLGDRKSEQAETD